MVLDKSSPKFDLIKSHHSTLTSSDLNLYPVLENPINCRVVAIDPFLIPQETNFFELIQQSYNVSYFEDKS